MVVGDRVGEALDVVRFLRLKRRLRQRSGWKRDQIELYCRERLRTLIAFARSRSPFYRELYRDLPESPALTTLPVVEKRNLADDFDAIVTDPRVHLADVERFLQQPSRPRYFLGRYAALVTGGSTGMRSTVLRDRALASAGTALAMVRLPVTRSRRGRFRPPRIVWVASGDSRHASGFFPGVIPWPFSDSHGVALDDDWTKVTRELNQLDPDRITTYPSTAKRLAEAQRSGQLRLRLGGISTLSENLTPEIRASVSQAFGCPVHDVYNATETGTLGLGCECGNMHVPEDLVAIEVVDEENRPVPDGTCGEALLATQLENRIMPIIRYRLQDRIEMGVGPCPCGSQHRWIARIGGRSSANLVALESVKGGKVWVNGKKLQGDLLAHHMDILGAQIIEEAAGRLRANVLIRPEASEEATLRAARAVLVDSLVAQGADVERVRLEVIRVAELERLPISGKSFTFRSAQWT